MLLVILSALREMCVNSNSEFPVDLRLDWLRNKKKYRGKKGVCRAGAVTGYAVAALVV